LAGVRGQIVSLYAYDEETEPGRPAPIKALYDTWHGQEVWQAPGLSPELATACRWAAALALIETKQPGQVANDRGWLREQALATPTDVPIALAAWRRLGTVDWPRGDAERQDDASMRRAIEVQLAAWVSLAPERRSLVEWELKTEGQRRTVREVLERLDADPDAALKRFVRFYRDTYREVRGAAGDEARLAELTATSSLAQGLARVVMTPEWPGDYDRVSMERALPPPETFNETFYQGWPERAEGFRLLRPDPRGDPATWERTIARLRAAQAGLEPFPAEKELAVGQLGGIVTLRDDLFATPGVRANRETIEERRARLEATIADYDASFAAITDERLLTAEQWDRRLAQLAQDIEDLAAGNPELRALHGALAELVKQLLRTAPIARNREAVATLLARSAKLEQDIQDGTNPSVWLERVAAQQTISADAQANHVWQSLRGEALQGITAEALKGDRGLYRTLRDRLGAVVDFLATRQWDEVLPPALPTPAPGLTELAWHQDILPGLTRQRQETLTAAALRSAESPKEAETILNAYVEARRALALARDQLTLADLRLSQWALPREALDATGTTTIGDCLRLWTGGRPELDALRRALPRLDAFCRDLFALSTSLDRLLAAATADEVLAAMPELLRQDQAEGPVAADPSAGLARPHAVGLQFHAAYVRLGETGWPRTLAEMENDLAYSDRLLARVPAERQEALGRTLGAARRERWGRGYERLTECAAILYGSVELLPRLSLDARQAISAYAHLALPARVNLTVAWLVTELAAGARPEAALAARDEAAKMLTQLGAQVKYPDPMFTYIDERVRTLNSLATRDTDAAVRGLARSGPGRVGWQLAADPERRKAVYSTTLGGSAYALTFVRVRADAEDTARAAFVCTTELPVGLFVNACSHLRDATGRTLGEQMVPFLAEELRPPAPDPRRGPRTWQMQADGERLGPVAPLRLWLTETQTFPEASHYPPGATPPPPTRDHPLQYIPPRAAIFLCLAMGCRVPTPYEWQQAVQEQPADSRSPNLRDALWRQQHEHIRNLVLPRQGLGLGKLLAGKAEKHWPNADAFPSGTLSEELDSDCIEGNDGSLWLREVPGGGTSTVDSFTDLFGNVREFVYDDSRSLDRLLDRQAISREDLRAELTNPRKFAVIGDSALGRPIPPEQRTLPQPIPAGVSGWDRGFSDVGVRLAFTAPEENLSDKLKALAETLCLTPTGK
jgi:hypothetical protein